MPDDDGGGDGMSSLIHGQNTVSFAKQAENAVIHV